jgi:RNA-binding protein
MVRAIGRVKTIFGHHILIIECDAAKLPRLYSKVIDKRWKPVGKLIDIFGNVASPYAAVLTTCDEPKRFVGERLFIK